MSHQAVTPGSPVSLGSPAAASVASSRSRRSFSSRGNYKEVMHALDSPAFLCSITENRTREIGFASMDLQTNTLHLVEFCDSHAYAQLFTLLYLFDPVEIIMSNTAQESELAQMVQDRVRTAKHVSVVRHFFNETSGEILLKDKVLLDPNEVDVLVQGKYLCLAAFNALLKYTEEARSITVMNKTMRLRYGWDGVMLIDSGTLKSLEILQSRRTGESKQSLFAVIDRTVTPQGRLLKASLCQPLSNMQDIDNRQEAVAELASMRIESQARAVLNGIADLDPLRSSGMSSIVHQKKGLKDRGAVHSRIKRVLALKQTLEKLPNLAVSIASCRSSLLVVSRHNLTHPSLRDILAMIYEIIDPSVIYVHGVKQEQQIVMAIRPGLNAVLDAARKIYEETEREARQLVERYREQHQIEDLKMTYTSKRGFYLSFPATSRVPNGFYNTDRSTKRITATTSELENWSDRHRQAVTEIVLATDRMLDSIIAKLRDHLRVLYSIADSIAYIDVLQSFATYSKELETTRPSFVSSGETLITQAKNPLLYGLFKHSRPIIANSIYASDIAANFHILTGPNMAGKSTYLSTVCLIHILAQSGCPIPAQRAVIRVTDRIFTRTVNDDSNIESTSGSFTTEMSELAYIMKSATDNSIIVIDELGKSSIASEAEPIVFASCEYLLCLNSFTFFATHFTDMSSQLERMYPNVKSHHFIVDRGEDNHMIFRYQLRDGVTREENYGIDSLVLTGWDDSIISEARGISLKLQAEKSQQQSPSSDLDRRYHEIAERLVSLQYSTMSETALRAKVASLKAALLALDEESATLGAESMGAHSD